MVTKGKFHTMENHEDFYVYDTQAKDNALNFDNNPSEYGYKLVE